MSGTNPGAWPDDWHGDEDDGKMLFIDEAGTIRPSWKRLFAI